MKQKIYGVVPPIPTPLDENERVDEKALRAMVDHCIDAGMHALFVCGTNGECLSLRQEERNRAIRITLDQTAGRVPVLAGCMDTSTSRVIDNIKAFEQMGGQTAVVTAEFYSRHSSPDETIRHFETIADQTQADIFIYNIPAFTGTTIPVSSIFRLAKHEHIVGYKDTSGSFVDHLSCIDHFRGTDFSVLQGMTQLSGPSMLMGADGCVPGIAPAFPELCVRLYEFAKNQETEKVREYSYLLLEAQSACTVARNTMSSAKFLNSLLGFMSERMCLPSEALSPEQKEFLTRKRNEIEERRQALGY